MHAKEDIDQTFKYLEDAIKIADAINDNLSYFMANYWLGIARWYNCEFDKSLYHFDKTLEINKATNTLWGAAISKGHIGFSVYDWQGMIDLGYQTCSEIRKLPANNNTIIVFLSARNEDAVKPTPRGVLISWATPATSPPRETIFSDSTRWS